MAKDDDFINNLENSFRNMKPENIPEGVNPLVIFTNSMNKLADSQNQKTSVMKCLFGFSARVIIAIGCIVAVMYLVNIDKFSLSNAWFPITLGFGSLITMGK